MYNIEYLTDDLTTYSYGCLTDEEAQRHPVYVEFEGKAYALYFDSVYSRVGYHVKLRHIVIVHRDSPLSLATVLHPNTGEARDNCGHPLRVLQGASIPAEVKLRAIQV